MKSCLLLVVWRDAITCFPHFSDLNDNYPLFSNTDNEIWQNWMRLEVAPNLFASHRCTFPKVKWSWNQRDWGCSTDCISRGDVPDFNYVSFHDCGWFRFRYSVTNYAMWMWARRMTKGFTHKLCLYTRSAFAADFRRHLCGFICKSDGPNLLPGKLSTAQKEEKKNSRSSGRGLQGRTLVRLVVIFIPPVHFKKEKEAVVRGSFKICLSAKFFSSSCIKYLHFPACDI